MVNSLKQWVEDNHGPKNLINKHNQNQLKDGFKWFLYREDCRQHHQACIQTIELLTNEDPSEYREIQKQINIRRKQAQNKFSYFTIYSCYYCYVIIIAKIHITMNNITHPFLLCFYCCLSPILYILYIFHFMKNFHVISVLVLI